jgi:hypothetical protein
MGFAMRYTNQDAFPDDIVHPTCARCGAPMWLTRIEPDEPGKQLRNFECQARGNSTNELVMFNAPACASKP